MTTLTKWLERRNTRIRYLARNMPVAELARKYEMTTQRVYQIIGNKKGKKDGLSV